jgi:hypothetical protein
MVVASQRGLADENEIGRVGQRLDLADEASDVVLGPEVTSKTM